LHLSGNLDDRGGGEGVLRIERPGDPTTQPAVITPLPDGTFLHTPARIVAHVDDGSLPVDLTLVTSVDEFGSAVAESVTIRRRPGGPPVTGERLREISIQTLVEEAVSHAATRGEWLHEDDKLVFRIAAEPGTGTETSESVPPPPPRRRPRRNAVTDEELRRTVDLYRQAKATPGLKDPLAWVGQQFDKSRSTAALWLRQAKEKGIE
jgi:hypothetical protein